MLILVAYDIETVSLEGRGRLRQVAKVCESVGKRVQNSVFECVLDAAQFRHLQDRLEEITDPELDRVRYYNLGNTYENRVSDRSKNHPPAYDRPLIL